MNTGEIGALDSISGGCDEVSEVVEMEEAVGVEEEVVGEVVGEEGVRGRSDVEDVRVVGVTSSSCRVIVPMSYAES